MSNVLFQCLDGINDQVKAETGKPLWEVCPRERAAQLQVAGPAVSVVGLAPSTVIKYVYEWYKVRQEEANNG